MSEHEVLLTLGKCEKLTKCWSIGGSRQRVGEGTNVVVVVVVVVVLAAADFE